jgi:Protein of unknown function, DUF481
MSINTVARDLYGPPSGRTLRQHALLPLLCVCCLFLCAGQVWAAAPPAAPGTDTLVLTDGEQLIGKLVKVLSGAVTFHSNVVGDVTVPIAKIRELHAAKSGQFAVIEKNLHITRKTAAQQVPVGSIAIENNAVQVVPQGAPARSIPANDVDLLIDAASFNRALRGNHDFLHDWSGSLTAGATLVKSTISSQTYTGVATLVRAVPTASWLPPSSKTTLNLSGTYGLARQPEITSGTTVLLPASETKTDILHGGAEYDKYWSRAFFGFVNAAADHNFGSGLQLQQAYGGGAGWTALRTPNSELDVKAAMVYEQQQFYNSAGSTSGTPTLNLTSAAVTENLKRSFMHGMVLNQYLTLTPAFNVAQAYSAMANAILTFPAYKRINFSLSSTDNYIGNPPQGYQRNTFQLTAGATYVFK